MTGFDFVKETCPGFPSVATVVQLPFLVRNDLHCLKFHRRCFGWSVAFLVPPYMVFAL